MLVLGIQGSPRKKGNTAHLLSIFMKAAAEMGAETITINPYDYKISPCLEYTACEKTGTCPIKDDVETLIYPLMRRATIIVTGSPAFFYSAPSQLKALIDRTQPLWSRKYRLNLDDPIRPFRKGFFLGLGATKGKRLFEGFDLMMRYFYDAAGASYEGMLGYREIEKPGDMAKHPTAENDVRTEAERLIRQYMTRLRLVFLCRDNSFLGPAAAAFTMKEAGCVYDAESFGINPSEKVHSGLVPLMAEKGIDLGFVNPAGIEKFHGDINSAMKIFIGSNESEADGFKYDVFWKTPDYKDQDVNLDAILDLISEKVSGLNK
ncbi:NAD(P)H-dependent oxidoreductase [Desulforegula conservatrix]|uniref:NAD(P)H-dependent oxidoreductase n=1 Tax=Desulforegula conservatrix TaxID=153026 RepID=UPI0003F97D47|nr:NAD(P)H-dependent oxidoreductase [Desulforegula conservatrix]